MTTFFDYSPEVGAALKAKKPVLALESTLITHGFPYPHNLEIARSVEAITRKQDVVPATIAIMDGRIKIGLTDKELESLVHNKSSVKASRRDISYILSKKLTAGTTVAATSYCAHAAGIKLFATGGIGGVHRGDDQDISADLIELARTPVAVICSGAKSILDLPKTLEYLETFSVPVIGFKTNSFPAFYTAKTNHKLYSSIDSVDELAALLTVHWELDMPTGVLIANPIPVEDEIPHTVIEPVIAAALEKASKNKISGKEITPFLLQEIVQVTQGQSMKANIKLIENNVQLGAQLAKSIS